MGCWQNDPDARQTFTELNMSLKTWEPCRGNTCDGNGKLPILLRHWSMSLRSHVRYARETKAVTCKRTFEVVAR